MSFTPEQLTWLIRQALSVRDDLAKMDDSEAEALLRNVFTTLPEVMTPEKQTRKVWDMFNRFTDEELKELLHLGGLIPCDSRKLMLHQALLVWFNGSIPYLLIAELQ